MAVSAFVGDPNDGRLRREKRRDRAPNRVGRTSGMSTGMTSTPTTPGRSTMSSPAINEESCPRSACGLSTNRAPHRSASAEVPGRTTADNQHVVGAASSKGSRQVQGERVVVGVRKERFPTGPSVSIHRRRGSALEPRAIVVPTAGIRSQRASSWGTQSGRFPAVFRQLLR